MGRSTFATRARVGTASVAVIAAALVAGAVAPASAHNDNSYKQTNFVSDQHGQAPLFDQHLVNAWGLAFGPTTPAWVADNGADVSTLYQGGNGMQDPSIMPLVVTIPGGAPTGAVFNPTKDFFVHSGKAKAAARFLFATEGGTIVGWAPTVPPPPTSTQGQVAKTVKGAVYKGLTLARVGRSNMLYAANFHRGTVDVFNHAFKKVHMPHAFVDHNLPASYVPFNVENIKGRIYVTYAKKETVDSLDELHGHGLGFVDVYQKSGRLIKRLVSHGNLDAPWGLAIAPHDFGAFSGALLVGNFGDGHINAYDRHNGAFLGQLHQADGHALVIDGLWALKFGNGIIGTPHTLLFTAGPADEEHGLFGSIEAR
jgi:uncharacterized protein (TIGR03118 family)